MTDQDGRGTAGVTAAKDTDAKVTDHSSVRVAPRGERATGRVLQRVILPREEDPLDVRPLYLDEPENVHSHVSSRRSVTVPPSAKVSFAAYFNAFPASYWKRWTRVREVVLRLCARGAGRIDVYRSKPSGDIVHLQGRLVRGAKQPTTLEFRIDLAPFEDGGWIWFDAFTNDSTLEIKDAAWTTDQDLPQQAMALATTTFNRPNDCVAALLVLGEDPAVLEVVRKVFVADQGTKKISDHPNFAEARKRLGDRLEVIDQDNLGGSGGFARGLYESIEHTDVDQVMLLDDDVRLEPDSVLRANAFAAAAAAPIIVGSQMLNLQAQSRLHSMGEVVDMGSLLWREAPGALTNHDFGTDSLRETEELHARIDATYNGWWMCTFPREVVERVGLPVPLFIKWDDAEYSLRAAKHGIPTVTLPGSAIWHMPWTDKNDGSDWGAYFHLRNRLILAALHSPHDMRKTFVKQGLRASLGQLVSMAYSTVAVQQKAVEDFLTGPEHLFASLRTALGEVRDLRAGYTDAQVLPSAREFPPPNVDLLHADRLLQKPTNPVEYVVRAAKALAHQLEPVDPAALRRPQVNVPAEGIRWYLLGALDSATVSNADGSAVAFRRRDPKIFRKLALRVVRNYRRLYREWPRLQRAYRAALPELTSKDSWKQVFGE